MPEIPDPRGAGTDTTKGARRDTYGPLVAIWASQNLANLFLNATVNVDTLHVTGGPNDTLVTSNDSLLSQFDTIPVNPSAVPVAQIFNFDNVPYPQLHIEPGLSCLYLTVNPQSRSGFNAHILKLPSQQRSCGRPGDYPRVRARPLVVRIGRSVNPASNPHIPPVARWDFDYRTGQHYIGIQCGSHWCDVGGAGFVPSPSHRAGTTSGQVMALINAQPTVATVEAGQMSRALEVKGWFDEQELAVRDVNRGIIPSHVIGLAIPHPQLEELTAAERTSFEDTWVAAAYVVMDSAYGGKVPFSAGITRLFLCAGGGGGCPIPAAKTPVCTEHTQDPDDRWFTMNISATNDTTYRCVKRHEHKGVIPAGAARWRWSEHDEQLWVRCTNGCCLVN